VGLTSLTDDLNGAFLELWDEITQGAGEFYVYIGARRARAIEELDQPDALGEDQVVITILRSDLPATPRINEQCSAGLLGRSPKRYVIMRAESLHGAPTVRLSLRPGGSRKR
jgi:hypothetical protein